MFLLCSFQFIIDNYPVIPHCVTHAVDTALNHETSFFCSELQSIMMLIQFLGDDMTWILAVFPELQRNLLTACAVWKIKPCDISYRKGRPTVGPWWNYFVLFLPFWHVFFSPSIYFLWYCTCLYMLNFHIHNETWILHSLNLHIPSFHAYFYQSCQKLQEKNIIYILLLLYIPVP